MTRRDRLRQIISKLDLKSSDNLEWVLDHLEALDDTTVLQIRLQNKKKHDISDEIPQGGSSSIGISPLDRGDSIPTSGRNLLPRRVYSSIPKKSKRRANY